MKRFMHSLWALPLILACAISCDQSGLEQEESVSIDGLEQSLTFPAVPTGDVSFTIASNVDWTISVDGLDWATVSPSRGLGSEGTKTVTISPAVNMTEAERTGTLTVVAGSVTYTATLTQDAATDEPVFNVSGVENDTFYLEALAEDGGMFTVSSNKDWTATVSGVEWGIVSPLSGKGNRAASVTVVPKTLNDDEVREGTISFDYGAAAPKVVKIVHKKFEPLISLSVSEMTATKLGGISNPVVTVTSNADWTAVSDADWVVLSASSGEFGDTDVTVSVLQNNEGKDRSATVTFTNRTVTAVLTVNQGNEYLTVTPSTISAGWRAGEVSFEVASNVEWKVESSESWATVTPSSAAGDATVKISIDEYNSTLAARTAVITVSSTNVEGIVETVNLTQNPQMYIDLTEPLLFNSNQQAWNMLYNPTYASAGNTGATGNVNGSGRLCSYTYPDNTDLYAQFESTKNPSGIIFIMAAEGNITFKQLWTDDALVFHIPVNELEQGKTLHFDYAIYGKGKYPVYWNLEASLDGGVTWESFTTGTSETSPNNGASSNSPASFTAAKELVYKTTYTVSATLRKAELLVRLRCVDGTYSREKKTLSTPSSGGTLRLLGSDQTVAGDANGATVKGPKFYVD